METRPGPLAYALPDGADGEPWLRRFARGVTLQVTAPAVPPAGPNETGPAPSPESRRNRPPGPHRSRRAAFCRPQPCHTSLPGPARAAFQPGAHPAGPDAAENRGVRPTPPGGLRTSPELRSAVFIDLSVKQTPRPETSPLLASCAPQTPTDRTPPTGPHRRRPPPPYGKRPRAQGLTYATRSPRAASGAAGRTNCRLSNMPAPLVQRLAGKTA